MALAILHTVDASYHRVLMGFLFLLLEALVLTVVFLYKKLPRTLRVLDYKLDWVVRDLTEMHAHMPTAPEPEAEGEQQRGGRVPDPPEPVFVREYMVPDEAYVAKFGKKVHFCSCLLYTSPSPRD
eukprot:8353215-Alexandrium_andersonii.AAC.1